MIVEGDDLSRWYNADMRKLRGVQGFREASAGEVAA